MNKFEKSLRDKNILIYIPLGNENQTSLIYQQTSCQFWA